MRFAALSTSRVLKSAPPGPLPTAWGEGELKIGGGKAICDERKSSYGLIQPQAISFILIISTMKCQAVASCSPIVGL